MTHTDSIARGPSASWENRNDERAALQEREFYERTQPFTNVVRARIREARDAKGLSGEQLALAMTEADYPMDKSTISRIESGERSLRDGELFAFAHVLDVPLVRLVSPLDGEPAVRFGGIGLDRHEV